MWYIRSDWWKLTNDSDVMNTTSHRVYQTGEGERGSEDAANDLGRLRIRLQRAGMSAVRRSDENEHEQKFLPARFASRVQHRLHEPEGRVQFVVDEKMYQDL